MKFSLDLRVRAAAVDPLPHMHESLLEFLKETIESWRCDPTKIGKMESAPPFAGCSLTKSLPTGVSGRAHYNRMSAPQDDAKDDHHLEVRFDPRKRDLLEFIDDVIPGLIAIWSPYVVDFSDETIQLDDWRDRIVTDRRHRFGRFGMVSYLDAELCRHAFGLTPAAAAVKVKKSVASVKADKQGMLVVLTREILDTAQLKELGATVRNLLPNSPFA